MTVLSSIIRLSEHALVNGMTCSSQISLSLYISSLNIYLSGKGLGLCTVAATTLLQSLEISSDGNAGAVSITMMNADSP
jgi:hypothetical protein